jgi:hypothetical protein
MSIFVSGRVRLVVAAFAVVVLGCASGASSASGVSTGNGGALSDGDNGRTVTVARGQQLTVALNSTYWTFAGPSNPAVLREVGQPVAVPGSCPPGVGCGDVIAKFTAVGPGRADITATRTSCGEALSCPAGSGSYRVSVVVT